MANPEHLAILKQGVEAWNAWRKDNPDIIPDLSGTELRGAELRRAKLQMAILLEANLSKTNLHEADLHRSMLWGADLQGADIRKANLQKADLREVNLLGADMRGADLKGAKLQEAELRWAKLQAVNLQDADMRNANLQGAKLEKAILLRAKIQNTHFSSQSVLNDLVSPLANEQLAGAIFEDKEAFYREKQDRPQGAPSLCIQFMDDRPWNPGRIGALLMGLYQGYTHLLYMITTRDGEQQIKETLGLPIYHLPERHDLHLLSISHASPLEFEIGTYATDPAVWAAVGFISFTAKLTLARIKDALEVAHKAAETRKLYWEGTEAKQRVKAITEPDKARDGGTDEQETPPPATVDTDAIAVTVTTTVLQELRMQGVLPQTPCRSEYVKNNQQLLLDAIEKGLGTLTFLVLQDKHKPKINDVPIPDHIPDYIPGLDDPPSEDDEPDDGTAPGM